MSEWTNLITSTVFTWLNTVVTIRHLCKMTVATIQGRLLFEGGIYCNVIMIHVATIQKPGSFTVEIILFVIILLRTTWYLHRYNFIVN